MAEFKISKFRYTWRGNWSQDILYLRDDVVRYGGSTYVCIRRHESDANFYTDLYFTAPGETNPSPAWVLMTEGFAWKGEWSPNTLYSLNDIVLYGGQIYLTTTAFTSTAVFDDGIANFAVYSSQIAWQNEWQTDTRYGINDVVKYNGIVYRCIEGHRSSIDDEPETGGLEFDQNKWQVLNEGVEYRGEWTSPVVYRLNDLVKFGGTIWRCKKSHTSALDSTVYFDAEEHWNVEFPGFKYSLIGEDSTVLSGEWNQEVSYKQGDVVKHGGYLFYALVANFNSVPTASIYQINNRDNPPEWAVLTAGINFRGTWSSLGQYKIGDVVKRGGNLYVAKLDTTADGSSLDYLDDSNWELLNEGHNLRGNWATGTFYVVGDIVKFTGSTYRANYSHTSSSQNFPGDNGSGFAYWDLLLQAGPKVGMTQRGDLLTYNLSRGLAGDTSTISETNIPKGTTGQLLTVIEDDTIAYRSWGAVERVRYVSPHGEDDPFDSERGINPFRPWKTIRFAAEKLDDGFTGTTTIRVSTGKYEEILPIIVPARTVVLGDELRSTTISANKPITALALDVTYTTAVLNRIFTLIEGLISGNRVNKTVGNTEEQVFLINNEVNPPQQITGSGEAGTNVKSMITDIISYIEFYIESTGLPPTLSGTNTATTDQGKLNGVLILEENKEFLAAEAVAFMKANYPEYAFDENLCKRDVRAYVDAWKYDLTYTGNYKSILAARYYRNAVLGSQSEDMFYMRDATGLRDCTLTGITGELNPPNVFDLYRLPTGGAFVSLDPGWGPADDRTWILTRSPYIQGVTTIGEGVIGQKIDGALHNGGNKSMVSNDFTQVLSDGVGAWVANGGRAELVSVFTYYCHVGYLTTNGGIIRATNGNCSYGRFGAISDGIDDTETPRFGVVDNQREEAQVAAAFAGEFVDEIQILEWSNAGINYTQATASITGAGVGATVIFEDFRDDAVFECKLLDTTPESINQQVGGGGYSVQQNNAQVSSNPATDLTGLTIASNDQNGLSDYQGKRITIISGSGTGQYAYITGYNTTTKVVTVARESDNQPGWDHVVPGKEIKVPLDTSTVYRIEPRVIFGDPGFTATLHNITDTDAWQAITYGETTEQYSNVLSTLGTGTVVPDDGLVPVIARFNVTKTGRSYTSVTISNAGAGYNVGDILTISGANLGGTPQENSITITVTGTTEDSTNSITSFTYDGVGASGKFVAIASGSNVAASSSTGELWNSSTLPSSGAWQDVAAGNNRFVAIRRGSNLAASSLDGQTWTSRTMPASRNWNAVTYGNGRFVAVSGNLNSVAISTNGTTWTSASMPTYGDSTINEWIGVTYGKGKFIAVANSGNIVAESVDGSTWTGHIMDVIADSSQKDWVGIAYGNDRFVAISSTGDVGYSFDGESWSPATMPTQDGSTAHYWKKIKYAQGVFFAVGSTGSRTVGNDATTGLTTYAATSADGIIWTGRTLSSEEDWVDVAFGNPYTSQLDSSVGKNTPMWVALATNSNNVSKIRTGKRALGRPVISSGVVNSIRIWDPGSGYVGSPDITLIDPNKSSDVLVDCRIGDGVLAGPSWTNRGTGYRTTTTRVTISGDGVADLIPVGKFVTLTGLERYPGPGAQLTFDTLDQIYTVVTITELGGTNGDLSATFRISPDLKVKNRLEHNTSVEIRERYSQCRITGHDFLDIGSGNFVETNYPDLYSGLYFSAPENEIVEEQGGRVFYTSTDQSGNFRCGELFAVEQATGIVTISADFFDFSGLTELRLGGIRVGGTGAVIREFSTDPLFTEDSNNIVPTQRAVARYLANRLSVGGAEIATASFIAGTVLVGPNKIASTIAGIIDIPVVANISGANAGVSGYILAQQMFARSFT